MEGTSHSTLTGHILGRGGGRLTIRPVVSRGRVAWMVSSPVPQAIGEPLDCDSYVERPRGFA